MAKNNSKYKDNHVHTLTVNDFIYFEDNTYPEGIIAKFRWCDKPQENYVELTPKDGGEKIVLLFDDLYDKKNLINAHELRKLEELIAEKKLGNIEVINDNSLPPNLRKRGENIVYVVEKIEERVSTARELGLWNEVRNEKGKFSYTKAVEKALDELKNEHLPEGYMVPNHSYYFTWRKKYNQNFGSKDMIAASFHRTTYNQSKFPPILFIFLEAVIPKYYRNSLPIDKATFRKAIVGIYEKTGGYWIDPQKCDKEAFVEWTQLLIEKKASPSMIKDGIERNIFTKFELPGRTWTYGFLRALEHRPDDDDRILEKRFGTDFWERNFLVFDQFIKIAQYPLQYVFADHYLIDLLGVDDETRKNKFRLWLTVLIDCYSRSIVGIYLDESSPSIESIQGALFDAICPKTYIKNYGIELEWIANGIPIKLSLDNAWAHMSHSLERLASIISQNGMYNSIVLDFRPPYKARYGGIIESLNANFAHDLRERLRTAIWNNDFKRRAFLDNNPCLLYEDIKKIILQLVVEHQHSPMKALNGENPHVKWIEGRKARTLPPISITDEIKRQFWHMYPDTRIITDKGVQWCGLHYSSPKLSKIHRVNAQGKTRKFTIRYDKNDISMIALFEYGTGKWLLDLYAKELALPGGGYRHRSLAEQKAINSRAYKAIYSSTVGIDHIDDSRRIEEQRKAEKNAIEKNSRAVKQPQTLNELDITASQTAYLAMLEAKGVGKK